uniref:Uncharacterized protein isoform X2 n=1 Tax=Nicotiana tabacum TaxID=4097 RepID=A0A1S4BNS8_TOBAC|nr:PREDICTED: uncharacterized protein LOC107810285 isoform X2 [Nicotiana tabacum]
MRLLLLLVSYLCNFSLFIAPLDRKWMANKNVTESVYRRRSDFLVVVLQIQLTPFCGYGAGIRSVRFLQGFSYTFVAPFSFLAFTSGLFYFPVDCILNSPWVDWHAYSLERGFILARRLDFRLYDLSTTHGVDWCLTHPS